MEERFKFITPPPKYHPFPNILPTVEPSFASEKMAADKPYHRLPEDTRPSMETIPAMTTVFLTWIHLRRRRKSPQEGMNHQDLLPSHNLHSFVGPLPVYCICTSRRFRVRSSHSRNDLPRRRYLEKPRRIILPSRRSLFHPHQNRKLWDGHYRPKSQSP